MSLHARYPAVSDLRARARTRIPHFVFEYLESGTGSETALLRNRAALDRIEMLPSILHGPFEPDLRTRLMEYEFPLPFGVAPVGMSGLIWPGAEVALAQAAAQADVPYCLSTVAAATPEDVAPHLGRHAWFQLYPPKDLGILRDMLARIKAAGFGTVVLTADVPVASRRERLTRSGLTQPPSLTPRLLWQVVRRPAWAFSVSKSGMPRMRTLEPYAPRNGSLPPHEHVGYLLRTSPDRRYLAELIRAWDGDVIIKGVLDPKTAASLTSEGVQALWVSNHAGRQFDGVPAAIDMLPRIRQVTDLPLIFDSGIEGGLDIIRAFALGADFVMLGRAWHYALGALGMKGPSHLVDLLTRDIVANMGQLGARNLSQLSGRLC